MSFAYGWDAVMYVYHVPTGQACFGDEWQVYAQLSLLSVVTRRVERRWTVGNRTAQLWLSALLILQREDSLGAMVSHSLEEWPVSVTRSWGS